MSEQEDPILFVTEKTLRLWLEILEYTKEKIEEEVKKAKRE